MVMKKYNAIKNKLLKNCRNDAFQIQERCVRYSDGSLKKALCGNLFLSGNFSFQLILPGVVHYQLFSKSMLAL